MTIEQLVQMAQRIHDVEGWQLGSASTRETRNAFWAKVIGCAYHGHPQYNLFPDRQWHLKRADITRPQTDDVATSLPSRNHWDCINGVGTDGYSFAINPHGPLPNDQIVYAPPKPEGEVPEPVPPPTLNFPPRDANQRFFAALDGFYKLKGRPNRGAPNDPIYVDNEGIYVWLGEFQRRYVLGATEAEATAAVLADIEAAWPK